MKWYSSSVVFIYKGRGLPLFCQYLEARMVSVKWVQSCPLQLSLRRNTHFFNSSFCDGSFCCYKRLISYIYLKRLVLNCLRLYPLQSCCLYSCVREKRQASGSWPTRSRAECRGNGRLGAQHFSTSVFQRRQPGPRTFVCSRMMAGHCKVWDLRRSC